MHEYGCRKVVLAISLFLFLSRPILAQTKQSDNIVGTNHILHSTVLNEDREIQIYLPDGYAETDTSYPVLYVMDGQRFYLYAVSLAQSFSHFHLAPEFIIVGIKNSYPQRFNHFDSGKEDFMEFVGDELLPYVEDNYRAKDERIYFGWEFAAGFGFHTMLANPDYFNGYILASPYPIKDSIDSINDSQSLDKMLYYSVSPDEYEINFAVNKLDSLLTEKQIDALNWTHLHLEIDQHRSTGYPTLYHGLRKYFEYYPELEVNNLQRFLDAGGMEYAKRYSKIRADQYGFDPELSLWSRYTIIRSAIRAEDYMHFDLLIQELSFDTLINELTNSTLSYTTLFIAQFYEKNEAFDKAAEVYAIMLKKFPESEKLLNRMGDAQLALGNKKEAIVYYEKAKAVVKISN